jgi:DNA repair exonuclease SbcCD nuclease subunit
MKILITADTHEGYWLKIYPPLSVVQSDFIRVKKNIKEIKPLTQKRRMKILITADTHEGYWLKIYPLLSVVQSDFIRVKEIV